MNKVFQTVTLGKDPELKTYGDGKSLVNFTGAVNKRFVKEGEDSADWFNYTAYGKTAEFINQYLKKYLAEDGFIMNQEDENTLTE